MSVLIGVGIVTTFTTIYLGRKGWQALHKAVGITRGALTYQDYDAPLSLSAIKWQRLNVNKQHLKSLPDNQLRQLQRIDKKFCNYQAYQKMLQAQKKTSAVTEQQFVLNKLLHTRLPDMLASYYHLTNISSSTNDLNHQNNVEASELLQQVLDNIEQRLDRLLEQMETQHLHKLRVMKNYINSHDS